VAQSSSPLLREVASRPRLDSTQVPQLVAAVIGAGGANRAMDEAQQTAKRAIAHLSDFPPSSAIRALAEICDFVLCRQA
jgi:geranylgeranyl pyrophosphate synthase